MTYPFVAATAPDYGRRRGPALALLYHMAEGGGTVGYLSRRDGPPRGVSVHVVCGYNGQVTQMLAWDRASGSLNPADRSSDKAYFGHRHLVDVLGAWWPDPNSAVLSMEIEGFAKTGPNPAQVDGAVAWGEDMKTHFPSLRGALGHADQTDTKGCPGMSLAMKLVFVGVGGHGLWHPQSAAEEDPVTLPTINDEVRRMVELHVGDDDLLDLAGRPLVPISRDQVQQSPMSLRLGGGTYYLISVVTGGVNTPALLHATAAANPKVITTSGDCTAAVNTALDHLTGPVDAVLAAIKEARPR